MKILIIKTSSLGDIIQSFPVLSALHEAFPDSLIDWVVEEDLASVVKSHPLVRKVIAFPLRRLKRNFFSKSSWRDFFSSMKELREERYRWVFDLQGNIKSGLITWQSVADVKIGFGLSSVREWPNILATKVRFAVPKHANIRSQYLSLIDQFLQTQRDQTILLSLDKMLPVYRLKIEESQKKLIDPLCRPNTFMVCPCSKWKNKQLSQETLISFLNTLEQKYEPHLLLVWGSLEEKKYCEQIQSKCKKATVLTQCLPIPAWQYLMSAMDLVIAVDSSALHLCGTLSTPSFSIFGPTSSDVFKPLGDNHLSFQGSCPYGKTFLKQCPILRTCPSGSCIREIRLEDLLREFIPWWENKTKLHYI